jgi:hypothetical protein
MIIVLLIVKPYVRGESRLFLASAPQEVLSFTNVLGGIF